MCPFCELKIEDRDELVAAGLAAAEVSIYKHQLLPEEPDASVASDESERLLVTGPRRIDVEAAAGNVVPSAGRDFDPLIAGIRQQILDAWKLASK